MCYTIIMISLLLLVYLIGGDIDHLLKWVVIFGVILAFFELDRRNGYINNYLLRTSYFYTFAFGLVLCPYFLI